jgi:hypothetical protein
MLYNVAGPTIFSAEHDNGRVSDFYAITVTNAGNQPTNGSQITIADTLPSGLQAERVFGNSNTNTNNKKISEVCSSVSVGCTFTGVLEPGERLQMVVQVAVAPGTQGPVIDSATVSGGGAATVSTNVTTPIGSATESLAAPFGLAAVVQHVTNDEGSLDAQAGDHPFEATLNFSLNTVDALDASEEVRSAGGVGGEPAHTKDIVVEEPPGLVGDPDVVERCPQYDLKSNHCPPGSQIGVAFIGTLYRSEADGSLNSAPALPVYDIVPDRGYAAEFGFVVGDVPVPLYVTVNPETNYGVRLVTPGIPEQGAPQDVQFTFFGTPSTDLNTYNGLSHLGVNGTPLSFLDSPTDCSPEPATVRVSVDSWEHPGAWLPDGSPDYSDPNWITRSTAAVPTLTGCDLLQFDPSISVTPDTTQADEPAGVSVELQIPQAPQQFPALTTSDVKGTVVTLPSGMSLSPSAADGLQGCSDEQIALSSPEPATCPSASQVGTIQVKTPLLPEPLEGQVFLGDPHCDPCTNADASDGNMYRLFLQIAGPGVRVKKEGRIYANTSTGQLTSDFPDLPQVPINNVKLKFNSGLRAGLATPQTCGAATTSADYTPWSTPITADATPQSSFQVDWDGKGGACPSTLPFAPSFSAGTSNPDAGQFSPLTVTLGREDREQDLSSVQVRTPPGLLGMLSSVSLCGEPQADLGTCSQASQIGTLTVAAGPGSHPFYEHGQIYLTGPYKSAPFGLSIVVPTVAGPFNLGNVVVRAQVNVDPNTTALTVTTDPLPQILDGIPLRLRTTNVTIDRPDFVFNPSSCAQQSITAVTSGSQGTHSEASVPFAVSGCAGLAFHPRFEVSTSAHISRQDGASLDAKLIYPSGPQSAVAHVRVELPKQLPSRLTTLQHACPAAVFNTDPASCPTASIVGIAKAVTPVLPVPLTGPAYFVSHGGEAFPNLVIVLEGYGTRVDLVGDTYISKAGITSSTFNDVPDVPVNSFELILPEGPHSALAANGDLCKQKFAMPVSFAAQDGAQIKEDAKVHVTGCPKATASRAHRARARNARRNRRVK